MNINIEEIQNWLNDNTGVVSVFLFLGTILVGWLTGFFKALIRRPRFKIRVIPKMTLGCVFNTGRQYTPPMQGTYDLTKTAFVIYLEIINAGTTASNLGKIRIGYNRNNGKRAIFQKRLWIYEYNILDTFSIPSGDGQSLLIPHLRQVTPELNKSYNGYIEVGNSLIGAAYFEQPVSWGNHTPRFDENGFTDIKIIVEDAFKNKYRKRAKVKMIPIQDALTYNPKFGMTEHFLEREIFDFDSKEEQGNKGGLMETENLEE
jgi:hypothetical protein